MLELDYLINIAFKLNGNTVSEIACPGKGQKEGCTIEVFQSNHEGAIIDRIQDSYFDGTEGIVINPGEWV